MKRGLFSFVAATTLCVSCGDPPEPPKLPPPTMATVAPRPPRTEAPPPAQARFDAIPIDAFNTRAQETALPFQWASDDNGNGALDPNELVIVWGIHRDAKLDHYVSNGAFTHHFTMLYQHLARRAPVARDARDLLVRKELAQSRPTLIRTNLRGASESDKKLAAHVMEISLAIDALYEKQRGTFALREKLAKDDRPGHALFFRNHGPRCEAPLTEKDPACDAIEGDDRSKKLTGLYPEDRIQQPGFCESLSKEKDKKLTDPFTVVRAKAGGTGLEAVPFTVAFAPEMSAVARELDAAAADLDDPKEAALRAYLKADAEAFRTNDWVPADEAWSKMNADDSRFYLRVAPDETYREPCNLKALFGVTFGLIDQTSKKWQAKFTPLKDAMEAYFAELAGPPYKARAVHFKLPDFVDVALNAGDARMPYDTVIGQSLPNFGKVADEARGRTMAMPNFYTDVESIHEIESQAKSLFCEDAMRFYTRDPEPLLMSTVLHEAGHNLGPNNPYRIGGKSDRDLFGGPLASTLEEAKAESGSLLLITWLEPKKELTLEEANRALLADILWGFGQISKGMYDDEKQPRSYAQLEAMQVGALMKEGAMSWNAGKTAANGVDAGCFDIKYEALPAALRAHVKDLLGTKARGDKKRAQALVADYVDTTGDRKKTLDLITARMNRVRKATFLYAIEL